MVHWKNAAKKFVVSSMVLGAALLLNACGGGDSGGSIVGSGSSGGGSVGSGGGPGSPGGGSVGSGGGSGGSGGGTTATYLAYAVKEGGLYLVDPANPTQPIKITDKAVNILHEEYAVSSLDLNTKQYKDLHVRAIYYVEGDKGPLMRLSLVKGNSAPTPVQVSDLKDVCYVQESEGLVGTHVMIVGTPGKDGNCYTDDDDKYIVTSDMNSTSKSIDVTGKDVVTFVVDNDLMVKGVIIKDSNTLKYCNVDLSNCSSPLASSVTAVDDIASNTQTQKEYLCVDGKIQILDLSQPKPTLSQTSIDCENGGNYDQDDKYIYHVNNGNIERLDMNNVAAGWQTIYNGGDIDYIEEMTQNYLIASVQNTNTNTTQLLAVKKDGSSKTVISDVNVFYYIPISTRLYFTKYTQDLNGKYIVNACYWDEGSANPFCESNGTAWIGLSYAVNGTLNYSSSYPVYKLLKVEGSNGLAGGTLYAVDPSNLNSKINLGNIPSDFSIFGYGIGDNILLFGGNTNPPNYQSDIFFANLSTPNSLKNITNTPDKSEIPYYSY